MKVVAQNRRARHDYQILDTFEAGIHLTGQEVKSCRQGHVNLAGGYVSFADGTVKLKNVSVSPYSNASGLDGYEPSRDRLLLLKKSEIEKLQTMVNEKGIAVIPLEVRAGRFIKILFGVGRGQKKYDKRQKIKEKDVQKKLRTGHDY